MIHYFTHNSSPNSKYATYLSTPFRCTTPEKKNSLPTSNCLRNSNPQSVPILPLLNMGSYCSTICSDSDADSNPDIDSDNHIFSSFPQISPDPDPINDTPASHPQLFCRLLQTRSPSTSKTPATSKSPTVSSPGTP
jgi:hypothetical protein